MQHYSIGMVLSGGGARGVAHLGALQALHEEGIYPQAISGTSAGAIVGAFYASGFAPKEILAILKEISYLRAMRPGLWGRGFISKKSMYRILNQYLPCKTFEELVMPLTVCAVNMRLGRPEYFDSGELILRVTASGAVPVLVSPVEMDGELYSDGGILNNFPVDPLDGRCELLLGVSVNPISHKHESLRSLRSIAERTYLLSIRDNASHRERRCDWHIEPPGLTGVGIMDIRKADKCYKMGYDEAKSQMDHLIKVIRDSEMELPPQIGGKGRN